MSMQSLISGAECAASSNPLSQILKHADGDRTLQRDRVNANSSSSMYHLPSTTAFQAAEADVTAARQFFDAQRSAPMLTGHDFRSMGMADMERARAREMHVAPGLSAAATWDKSSTIMARMDTPSSSHWTAEFESRGVPAAQSRGQVFDAPQSYMHPAIMPQAVFRPAMFPYRSGTQPQITDVKGKGKISDTAFDAAFSRAAEFATLSSTARIEEVSDLSATLNSVDLNGKEQTGESGDYMSDFQQVWEQLRKSDLPPPAEDFAKWESQFNQLNSSQRDDFDFESDLQEAYRSAYADPVRFDDEGIPFLEPYAFESNNLYLQARASSRLQEARDLLARNGSLTEAALMLEAAIQQGDLGHGGYEAWILLGETRSMDEREDAAMRALYQGTQLAHAAGETTEGLMSLAISFTNENFERGSHAILLRWIAARYPGVVLPPLSGTAPWESHERATEAFLAVAREQHASESTVDPDLQIGLGVLFYANGKFDLAQDCFETALSARPRDYLLWNRLGSCLSNGSKPEEALGAYQHALQLRPSYVRAMYNVGVACLNIGAHEEAAKHFLTALSLQESTAGEKSKQLWLTLERCFVYMHRRDLAERAHEGANVDSFRSDIEF